MLGDSLFRDPLMPRDAMERYNRERFMLDTHAERRIEAPAPRGRSLRAVLTRAFRF